MTVRVTNHNISLIHYILFVDLRDFFIKLQTKFKLWKTQVFAVLALSSWFYFNGIFTTLKLFCWISCEAKQSHFTTIQYNLTESNTDFLNSKSVPTLPIIIGNCCTILLYTIYALSITGIFFLFTNQELVVAVCPRYTFNFTEKKWKLLAFFFILILPYHTV